MSEGFAGAVDAVVSRAPLPRAVERWTRLALVDTLGALAAGRATAAARAASRTAARWPSAPMTAFADATAASALDWDDGHDAAGGVHAGSTVIPAVLAMAAPDAGIDDLLAPIVVGYEVALRAGRALSPAVTGERYRASGRASAIGAAAAVAALHGVDANTAAASLRIAEAHAPQASMTSLGAKESIGWAAATGVVAAIMAMDGAEPDSGSAPPMRFPSCLDADDPLVRDWSVRLCTSGYAKPFAACRATHSALAAIAAAGVREADVEEIEISVAPGLEMLAQIDVRSLPEAQFSFPLAVAALLRSGAVDAGSFGDDAVAALAGSDLVRRIRVVAADDVPAAGPFPARVKVRSGAGVRVLPPAVALGLSDEGILAKARKILDARAREDVVHDILAGRGDVTDLRATIAP